MSWKIALTIRVFVTLDFKITVCLSIVVDISLQSLKLLSVMAAIRLDEETDKIEDTLLLALVDVSSNGVKNRSIQSLDPLASSSWQEVINDLVTFSCDTILV